MISEVVAEIMRITAPSCVLGLVMVWEVFLLKNIDKGLVGFSSLVEKGFPGYFLCSCAWLFFL
jgi:hypothetical protein